METEWFTLQDARLQLRPYSEPNFEVAVAASISPTGARAAGKHGIGLMSIAATTRQGFDAIGSHWKTWNEVAAQHGNAADRVEVAARRPDAYRGDEGASRARTWNTASCRSRSTSRTCSRPVPTRGDTPEEIIANVDEDGFAVIGTPDDAIAKIESFVERVGWLRHLPAVRSRLGVSRGDQAKLRALRAIRHAALHRPARPRPPRRANGSPAAAASS